MKILENKKCYPMAPSLPRGMISEGPDFVGIGTPRSGTSVLAIWLSVHPEVHVELSLAPILEPEYNIKERHFFAHTLFGLSEYDVEQYRQWFPKPQGKKTGEFTPNYFNNVWVPAQLKRAAPNAKLIVLLRDPIKRFISAISMFGSSVRDYQYNYHHGFYRRQFELWFRFFSREQFFIIQYEKLKLDPKRQFTELCSFLELSQITLPDAVYTTQVNTSKHVEIPRSVLEPLKVAYESEILSLKELLPEFDFSLWGGA